MPDLIEKVLTSVRIHGKPWSKIHAEAWQALSKANPHDSLFAQTCCSVSKIYLNYFELARCLFAHPSLPE